MADARPETICPPVDVVDENLAAYNATFVGRVDLTPNAAYFYVEPDEDAGHFEPGQYLTLGLGVYGRLVQRPYSVASASPKLRDAPYELLIRRVASGRFTTMLWELPAGHRIRVSGPRGRFTDVLDDGRTRLFVSSGTAIAPFVCMLRSAMLKGPIPRTVLLHGVSYASELAFRNVVEGWVGEMRHLSYIPTVSRGDHPANAGWIGRTGRVDALINVVCDELALASSTTIAFLCGNPMMVKGAEASLLARGFADGDVRKEAYWPDVRPVDRVG